MWKAQTDGKEGLKSLELLIAAYIQQKMGKPYLCRWNIK